MSEQMPKKSWWQKPWPYVGLVVVAAIATIVVFALLMNIQNKKAEATQYPLKVVDIPADELDPAVWGQNYPMEYDSFMQTATNYGQTPYGGSDPYSKLERYPAMKRLWAGYAFSVEHNEDRGHQYALQDQLDTERIVVKEQPAACANCHAAEAPQLIEKMGWEAFNHTPYNELKSELHTGTSCADCHDPDTMELRITRPAFVNAMAKRGVDVTKASRQEMRTYVCEQCHVEYYFAGDNKVLTFPWEKGMTIDDIDAYYTEIGFTDWTHNETGGGMLKIQHPEIENCTAPVCMPRRAWPAPTATCPTCAKAASRSRITGCAARSSISAGRARPATTTRKKS